MEITNIFDTWGMGKLNVVYTYNVRSIHIEGNEVLSPTTEWTNLQNTVLRERCQTQKVTHVFYDSIYKKYPEQAHLQRWGAG